MILLSTQKVAKAETAISATIDPINTLMLLLKLPWLMV